MSRDAAAPRPGVTLAAMCVAQGMILLDVTIVNVALPSMQRALGVTPANLEWVISAYTLALAALILVGGGFGDRYGRKRVFLVGLGVFTGASALCALAPDDPQLIAARAAQGVGGALMAALTLSILVDAVPPDRRTAAIGIWAAVAGLGFGLGPILGGLLIQAFDWSAVFWVNVPLGIAAFVVTALGVRESRDPGARRLDPLGAVLAAGGLGLLTVGLIETNQAAWTSPRVVALLGAAALLLIGLVVWERRAPSPMLPPAVLRERGLAAGSAVYAFAYLALAGMFFWATLFFQNLAGWSALRTGLSWIPLNLPFLAVSLAAGRVGATFGARRVVVVGAVLGAVGMASLAQIDARTPYRGAWPGYVLVGLGYGLLVPAVSAAAMASVPPATAGIGSGVLNSARQVGASVGLAVLGSLGVAAAARSWTQAVQAMPADLRGAAHGVLQRVAGAEARSVADTLGAAALAPAVAAFLDGYRVALRAAAAALALAALTALVGLPPSGRHRQ